MTDHDAYVTGSVTRGMCVCGEPWCESDGGPCHFVCDRCGKIVANENSSDEKGRATHSRWGDDIDWDQEGDDEEEDE